MIGSALDARCMALPLSHYMCNSLVGKATYVAKVYTQVATRLYQLVVRHSPPHMVQYLCSFAAASLI